MIMLLGMKNDPVLDPLLTLSQDLINSNQTFQKLHSLARGKVKRKYRGSARRFELEETGNLISDGRFNSIHNEGLSKNKSNKPWPAVKEDSGVSQRENLAPTRPIKWKQPQSRLVIRQKIDRCCNRVKIKSCEQNVSFCDKEVQTYSVILTQSFDDSDLTCLSIDHSLTGRDTDFDDSMMDSLTQLSTLSLVQPEIDTSLQSDADTSVQSDADTSIQSDVDTSVQSDAVTSVQSDADTSVQLVLDADTSVQLDVDYLSDTSIPVKSDVCYVIGLKHLTARTNLIS